MKQPDQIYLNGKKKTNLKNHFVSYPLGGCVSSMAVIAKGNGIGRPS